MLTPEDIKKVAVLSRLNLTDDEIKLYEKQLNDIMSFFNELSEVDTSAAPDESHIIPMINVKREDENKTSFTPQETVQNAPESEGDYFKVPRVIE